MLCREPQAARWWCLRWIHHALLAAASDDAHAEYFQH
jgi:hypothetical protein